MNAFALDLANVPSTTQSPNQIHRIHHLLAEELRFQVLTVKKCNLGGGAGKPKFRIKKRLTALQPVLKIYGTQSAMKTFVSCGSLALRFEAQTRFFPSGLNIGNPSNPGL